MHQLVRINQADVRKGAKITVKEAAPGTIPTPPKQNHLLNSLCKAIIIKMNCLTCMDGIEYFAVCIPSWSEASDHRGLRAERQHTERCFNGINGVYCRISHNRIQGSCSLSGSLYLEFPQEPCYLNIRIICSPCTLQAKCLKTWRFFYVRNQKCEEKKVAC